MISNTIERLFIVDSNTLLQKLCFFPHVRNFTLINGLFSCLMDVLFGPIFMELSKHLKKLQNTFCLHFTNSNLNVIFSTLSYSLFFYHLSYLKSLLNLCDEYNFFFIYDCHEIGFKKLIFQKSLTLHETNLMLFFLSFSLAWSKTKAESSNIQQ